MIISDYPTFHCRVAEVLQAHIQGKKVSKQILSLIIDGMDQKTTSIPKPRLLSKHASAMWKLSCHVFAVIVHGRGYHVYVDITE